MKKITLVAALLVGAFTFAQAPVIDRLPDNSVGLISTKGDDGTGVYCADYFVLDSDTALGEFVFPGFSSTGAISPFVEGFNVYIFADDGGFPDGDPETAGSAVVELADLTTGYELDESNNQLVFTVSVTEANGSQVVLPAGNYWVSAFPSVIGGPAEGGRWNWQGSISAAPANEPLLIDPADLFGAGATFWTSISDLTGENFPSFGWTLTDEALSVGDNIADMISIYPNPATDVLNIQVPSSIEVTNVSMFDVLGKRVDVAFSNGTVNTAALAQGVYVVKIETTSGTLTQKVVKQ